MRWSIPIWCRGRGPVRPDRGSSAGRRAPGREVEIIDVRDHIGGNVAQLHGRGDRRGGTHGREKRNPFRTSNKRVRDWREPFPQASRTTHCVYATHDAGVSPPINLAPSTSSSIAHYTPGYAKALVESQVGRIGGHGPEEPQRQGHLPDRPPAVRCVHQELHGAGRLIS